MSRGAGRIVVALALLLAAAPLGANGGTVRVSRAAVGPYRVSVFTSPTPLRTGTVDVSVLVQDSADAAVDVPVRVEARPVGGTEGTGGTAENGGTLRHPATRDQATNKLFKAAKFRVPSPGEWEFRVAVGSEAGPGGEVSFRATLAEPTLLDHPYLLALLVLVPLGVAGWLLLGREDAASP